METGEEIVMRRTLATDGRSRAFINDQAVGVGLQKDVGSLLLFVEFTAVGDRGHVEQVAGVERGVIPPPEFLLPRSGRLLAGGKGLRVDGRLGETRPGRYYVLCDIR